MEWSLGVGGWLCWFVRQLEGQLSGQRKLDEVRMGMADTHVALWQSPHHHGRLNLSRRGYRAWGLAMIVPETDTRKDEWEIAGSSQTHTSGRLFFSNTALLLHSLRLYREIPWPGPGFYHSSLTVASRSTIAPPRMDFTLPLYLKQNRDGRQGGQGWRGS